MMAAAILKINNGYNFFTQLHTICQNGYNSSRCCLDLLEILHGDENNVPKTNLPLKFSSHKIQDDGCRHLENK